MTPQDVAVTDKLAQSLFATSGGGAESFFMLISKQSNSTAEVAERRDGEGNDSPVFVEASNGTAKTPRGGKKKKNS